MPVTYEWAIETFDPETGDISEVNHADTLREIPESWLKADAPNEVRLVLIRETGNGMDGITSRFWAYPDAYMPTYFEDCGVDTRIAVPRRFHDELDEWLESYP